MEKERIKKSKTETSGAKYKRKMSLMDLIDNVDRKIGGAQDPLHRAQLETYFSTLMDELN